MGIQCPLAMRMMGRDLLRVALALPRMSAHSGGVERCLSLVEHSGMVKVDYTALVPAEGIRDANVLKRLQALEQQGHVTLRFAANANHTGLTRFDAVVAPTEFWTGPLGRARAGGIVGPAFVEFMQLPYVGTLDVLKTRGIESPGTVDLLRLPLIAAKVLGDSLSLTTFQAAACVLSVRSVAHLERKRVMGLTRVVSKNLNAVGFVGDPVVPECPVGVDTELVKRILQEEYEPTYDAVYVGRYHPHKGFLDLPGIVAAMQRRMGRDVSVAVCGTPQFPRHLRAFRRRAEELGVQRSLVMRGWQTKENLYRTIAQSRLLLYPSYVDSFSITVLETLCLAVPVVAYAIDALRLVWAGRDEVVLAPVGDGDALANLAAGLLGRGESEDLRRGAGDRSRRLLESYTWEKAAQSERRFYDEGLLGSR